MNELELRAQFYEFLDVFLVDFYHQETPLASLSAAENEVAAKHENGKFGFSSFGAESVCFCSKQKIVFVEKIFFSRRFLSGGEPGLIAAVGG